MGEDEELVPFYVPRSVLKRLLGKAQGELPLPPPADKLEVVRQDEIDWSIKKTIFPYYLTKIRGEDSIYRLTPQRLAKGRQRFMDCMQIASNDFVKAGQLMILAIDRLAASDFHMGRKPGQPKKYCDWIDNLFKSTEQLEKWLED